MGVESLVAVLFLAGAAAAALPCDPCGGAAPVCGYQDGSTNCEGCDPTSIGECYGGYCLANGACASCDSGGACVQCGADLDCPYQMTCAGGVCSCNSSSSCQEGVYRGACYDGLCYFD